MKYGEYVQWICKEYLKTESDDPEYREKVAKFANLIIEDVENFGAFAQLTQIICELHPHFMDDLLRKVTKIRAEVFLELLHGKAEDLLSKLEEEEKGKEGSKDS